MNLSRRFAPWAAAAALALTVLSACGSSSDDAAVAEDCKPRWTFPTVSEGKLTVATLEAPPYYSSAAGSAEGIDFDLLSEFAKEACLTTDWKAQPGAAVVESVAQERTDVAAGGWYATEERAKIVDQSDPSYVELPTLVVKGSDPVSDINALKGQRVGTIAGYTWVDEARALFGDDLKTYQSSDAVLADLDAGRIDAALTGGIDVPYLIAKGKMDLVSATMDPDPAIDSSVNPALPNYPHTKGNEELSAALNEFLDSARSDGLIAETLAKYNVDEALADVSKFQ